MHDRLRAARKRKRLTQVELARAINVHEASIRKWEAGDVQNIQIAHLYSLIKHLGIRFEWLVAGEEPCSGERAEALLDIECLLDMAEAVESVLQEYKIPKSVRERYALVARLYQAYKEDVPAAGRLERFKSSIRMILKPAGARERETLPGTGKAAEGSTG